MMTIILKRKFSEGYQRYFIKTDLGFDLYKIKTLHGIDGTAEYEFLIGVTDEKIANLWLTGAIIIEYVMLDKEADEPMVPGGNDDIRNR